MKGVSVAVFASLAGFAFVQPVPAADPVTYKEKVLHSFGSGTDGQNPFAGLTHMNGMLYGTTYRGGANGAGTVFAVNRKTGAESAVYSFCSQQDCADGQNPWGGLIDVKGTLYGTTYQGGSGFDGQEYGSAFALDPDTGAEKMLYSFCRQQNCPDGAGPLAKLIHVKGMLYGTTQGGGNVSSLGTAFALDPATDAETVLYSFCKQQNCADGQNPNPALVDVNGILYGTTVAGGSYGCDDSVTGCGTVFSLDPSTGAEKALHSFVGGSTDGAAPEASLIAVGGLLYGTTYWGGSTGCSAGYGCGTIFSLDPTTGAEKVLYSFCSQQNCMDGAEPFASLIAMNGTLYGTTYAGGGTGCGGYGCGTVFSIDPSTGAETVLYSFCSQQNCTDGATPYASVINVNGKLYGTTNAGGAYGYGTVFALNQKR